MRGLAILVLMIFGASFAQASVLSFKEWKNRRILESQSLISQVKLQKSLPEIERKSRLHHAQIKLEAAQELSANDYFHLYVIANIGRDPEKVRSVVKRLSKEELSEILSGYIDQTKKINKSSKTLDLRVISLQSAL